MSLKAFDLNYGFGGEPSTASLSFVYKSKTCGGEETHASAGALRGPISSGNGEIDTLLADFVIVGTKESKEGGYKTISYETVEKFSKRLESIAVLVRGVTFPSKGTAFKNFRQIFTNSETGFLTPDPTVYYADEEPFYEGDIAIIGRAFTSASITVYRATFTRFYSHGAIVGKSPDVWPTDPIELALIEQKFTENETNVALKYGYYLTDFKKVLTNYGYTVSNFPTDDNLMILDFGGSLKECLSSIASMYGMYWNCRGASIDFYSSGDIQAMSVPNFINSDTSIISASYSEQVSGKKKIGIIEGSADNLGAGGGGGRSGTRGKTIFFNHATISELYGLDTGIKSEKSVKAFLALFKLNPLEDLFNLMFWRLYIKEPTFANDPFIKNVYAGGDLNHVSTITKLILADFSLEEMNFLKKVAPNDLGFYSLRTDKDLFLDKPSTHDVYQKIKAACDAFCSVYVSTAVSERTATKYSVISDEGFQITKAYIGTTKISEIEELKSLRDAFNAIVDGGGGIMSDLQIWQISENVSGTNGKNLFKEKGYYYVGVKSFQDEDSKDEIAAKDALLNIVSLPLPSVPLNVENESYFAISNEREQAVKDAIDASIAFFNDFIKDEKKEIEIKATKIEDEYSSSSADDTTPYDAEGSLWDSEYKSFEIKVDSINGEYSSVDLLTFSGNIDEAKHIASNYSLLSNSDSEQINSSVTYSGLVIPSPNPLINSISITFSGGNVETSISYSNKEFLGVDQRVIMGKYSISSLRNFNSNLRPSQKNFLGVN